MERTIRILEGGRDAHGDGKFPGLSVNPRETEVTRNGDAIDPKQMRSRVIALTPEVSERERILPPGAGGAFGNAYKMLRTQVVKRMDQLGVNTLAVLSPTTGAGKTLTAINLAIAISAERERNALLVDFDFRNPSLHRRFGFEPAVGVDDCLQSKRPLHEAMVKIGGYDRLTLLPTRTTVDNSSELLSDHRTIDLVNELRTRYVNRIVIFDIPPVLEVDDALAFAHCVQAGLMIVREGHTRREDVTQSIDLLRELPILGTVLNESHERNRQSY